MKRISMLLIVMMVFMVGFTRVDAATNEVVLTAGQVAGAPDIENAINIATNYGTKPGMVTLDSSEGDFVYTDIDRSINIFVRNLTLRSENGAVIQNCANGIYFDALEEDHVTIEGITFNRDGSGVVSVYEHQDVSIRNNIFYVADYIVRLENGNDWQLLKNSGEARRYYPGFLIVNSNDIEVRGNILTAYDGIDLYSANESIVVKNKLQVTGDGIRVEGGSSYNRIATNTISGVENTGVFLGPLTEYNKILANRVQCENGFACEAVRDRSDSSTNKVAGNRLIQ